MNILFLYGSPHAKEISSWLENSKHKVYMCMDKNLDQFFSNHKFDIIISYTYRYMLDNQYIEMVKGNAVNIHIAYLPWNRGSNPNQWSIIENTPKGVTIHYMTSELDGGDIISQELVDFDENETLKSSYEKLHTKAVELFKKTFYLYPFWKDMRKKTESKGTYHNQADFAKYNKLINGDYSMKVTDFYNKAKDVS